MQQQNIYQRKVLGNVNFVQLENNNNNNRSSNGELWWRIDAAGRQRLLFWQIGGVLRQPRRSSRSQNCSHPAGRCRCYQSLFVTTAQEMILYPAWKCNVLFNPSSGWGIEFVIVRRRQQNRCAATGTLTIMHRLLGKEKKKWFGSGFILQ